MRKKYDQTSEMLIEPGPDFSFFWTDLYRYRGLFYFLAWRDVKVRYKQTAIGIAWSVLRPLLTTVVLVVVFNKVAKLHSGNVPYPVMVLSGLLSWQFFASTLSSSSGALVANANLLTKVYFPRLILPASAMIVSGIDFLISLPLLVGLMAWYRFVPDVKILLMPFFLLIAILASLGAGVWISAFDVKYRDFKYILPFIIQFGLYLSPVGFSTSVIPEKWKLLYSINPMVGVIDGFRWCLLGTDAHLYIPGFIISILLALLLFITGIWYFKTVERTFADII